MAQLLARSRFHPILHSFVYRLDNLHFFLTCHKWVYPHLCDRPQRAISSDIRGDRLIARRGRKSPANSRGGICNYSQTQTAGISFCHRAAITRNASCPKTANCRSPIPINSDIAPFSTRLLWTGRMPIPQENLLFVE